jgi:PDZ domain
MVPRLAEAAPQLWQIPCYHGPTRSPVNPMNKQSSRYLQTEVIKLSMLLTVLCGTGALAERPALPDAEGLKLAKEEYAKGNYTDCYDILDSLRFTKSAETPLMKGMVLLKMGRGAEAESSLRSVIKWQPDSEYAKQAEFLLESNFGGAKAISTDSKTGGHYGDIGITCKEGIVNNVYENSPASQAGIKPLDRIVSLQGSPVTGVSDSTVQNMFRGLVGTRTNLIIERKGKTYSCSVLRGRVIVSASGKREYPSIKTAQLPVTHRQTTAIPSPADNDLLQRKTRILEDGASEIDRLQKQASEEIKKINQNVVDQMADIPLTTRGVRGMYVTNPDYTATSQRLYAEARAKIDQINARTEKQVADITESCKRRAAAYDEIHSGMASQMKTGKSQIQLTPNNTNPYLRNFVNYDGSTPGALKAKAGTLPTENSSQSKQAHH